MNEATRNVRVGVFVLAALVVLSVLMVWFGETPSWLRRSDWELRITGVHDLAGVAEACPVTLGGVQIGRVSGIEFADPARPDQGVEIVASIERSYSVPRSAMARVYGATLGFGMGHIDLVIRPGLSMAPVDRKDARIPGEMRSMVGDFISKETLAMLEKTVRQIGEVAEAATPAAENLAELLEARPVSAIGASEAGQPPLQPNISTIIQRFEAVLSHADAVLGDPAVQDDLRDSVKNLREATNELRSTISLWSTESKRISENLNGGIESTQANLDRTFVKLNQGLDNLDTASRSLADIMKQTEAGQGTLGLLAQDERLYEAAVLTLMRLGDLAATLQRIAGKIEEDGYITVGQTTPVGTFTKKLPVGEQARTD